MWDTSARLLRLLALLQTHRSVTGPDLARRLGVGERTVRNDVDRLRTLGYPVEADRGSVGGYRLGVGAELPPLLLDDEEAVAVVLGLRAATGLAGVEETSVRALAKVQQVLPHRVRRRVAALGAYAVRVPADTPAPEVDPDVLTLVAGLCRDHVRLRMRYRTHHGDAGAREVEPYRLVAWGRRWYLLAWDPDRADWRTFRADRIEPRTPPEGPRFEPRPLPDDDVAAYVSRRVSAAAWRYRSEVLVHAPAEDVAARLPPAAGTVEARDATSCVFRSGADSLDTLAVQLGRLGLDFEVLAPPELVEHVAALAGRYARAVPPPGPTGR